MKKITLQRINERRGLENCDDVMVFVTNGIIRQSKSNFVLTTPHYFKTNVLLRFILYAIFDLLIQGEKPYLGLIKERVEDKENRSRYFKFLYQRIKTDAEFYTEKNETSINIYVKAVERCQIFYQSDYGIAYSRIMNFFIEIVKRRSSEGHWISYIKLTSKGKTLMNYYKMGYIF
ncbi:hypothetical protein HOA92_00030 [archaeon]|jgi:hypothetical protein|nr:hypothetical protein [archaeon]